MNYFVSLQDEYGYIHSIDKLSVIFVYGSSGRFVHPFLDKVKDTLVELFNAYSLTFDLKTNLAPMSSFSWTLHYLRPRFGLPVFVGYQNYNKDKTIDFRNVVRLEFNPNKVYEEDNLIDDIIRLLRAFEPVEVRVGRLDYAIDIPVALDRVVVLQSRKDKRYFKGTTYLGKRNNHNAVKIYDKQAEQCLNDPLTRFEITCKYAHKVKIDNIVVMRGDKEMGEEKLNCTTEVLVKMCLALKNAGYDYSDFLRGLNPRRRKEVISCVEGIGQTLVFDDALFEELYAEVVDKLKLGIEFPSCGRYGGEILDSGFLYLSEDEALNIPFMDV